ncbi:MAG: carbohydrate-binding protein CenC, partial [Serratia liquefaciens]|nr:carbohydrate-binding protein CenC [Serratia liquefaciens]
AGWSLASAQVVAGGHGGQSSLFYQNHNPANYHNMLQTLSVKPGQQLAFGAWVRGENLRGKGENQGAGVFVESYDDQGRFLAGSYPQGLLGTSGWQPVTGDFRVPPRAVKVVLGVYLRQGTTGNAWFDDVYACLQPVAPELYQMRSGNGAASSLIEVVGPQQVQVDSTLVDDKNTAVKRDSRRYAISGQQKVEFPLPADLAAGEYRLQQQVTDVASQRSQRSEMPISVGRPQPKVAGAHPRCRFQYLAQLQLRHRPRPL